VTKETTNNAMRKAKTLIFELAKRAERDDAFLQTAINMLEKDNDISVLFEFLKPNKYAFIGQNGRRLLEQTENLLRRIFSYDGDFKQLQLEAQRLGQTLQQVMRNSLEYLLRDGRLKAGDGGGADRAGGSGKAGDADGTLALQLVLLDSKIYSEAANFYQLWLSSLLYASVTCLGIAAAKFFAAHNLPAVSQQVNAQEKQLGEKSGGATSVKPVACANHDLDAVARRVDQIINMDLPRLAGSQTICAWAIRSYTLGGKDAPSAGGNASLATLYEFLWLDKNLDELVHLAGMIEIAPGLYRSASAADNWQAMLAGVGYLVGVPPLDAWRLTAAGVHQDLPVWAFNDVAFSPYDPLAMLKEYFHDDAFCVHPEDFALALERQARNLALKDDAR
jgi:hypothetical protein